MTGTERRRAYEFGPFRLDPAERMLLRERQPVALPPKAFDLLVHLVERHGHLVEKQTLMEALWPDAVVEETNLAYNVSAVRKALGDGQEGEQFIQTVPTRGYRFVAPVHEQRPDDAAPPAGPSRRRVIAAAALAVAGLAYWRSSGSERTPRQVVRFELPAVEFANITIPAISPDGSRVVYSALHGTERQLLLRALNSLQVTPLPGTIGARQPFFSPDGRSIGFFTGRILMTLDLATSQLATVCEVPISTGAAWGRDGRIYIGAGLRGLLAVPASGGTPVPLTHPVPGEGVHGWPELLPGGRHVLFSVWRLNDLDHAKVNTLSLDTGKHHTIVEGAVGAKYLATGHLAYIRQSTLFAVPFDLGTVRVRGSPVHVLDRVGSGVGAQPCYAVSSTGTLVYCQGSVLVPWTDMSWASGAVKQRIPAPAGYYVDPNLSADDGRLAVSPDYGARQDVWVHDFGRNTWTRLTTHDGFSAAPVWHPADPNAIVFTTIRQGRVGLDLFSMPADASGPFQLLYASAYAKYAISAAPAARLLAFVEIHPETRADVWLLDLRDKPAARPLLRTPFWEGCPALSPDGRWVAYESDESGGMQIYVRPVSDTTGKWVVSTDGGAKPRWSRDGTQILYVHDNRRMMTVRVVAGASFATERPRVLVETRPVPGGYVTPNYDLTLDGRRLLLITPAQDQPKIPLVVVQNWFAELEDKVGR